MLRLMFALLIGTKPALIPAAHVANSTLHFPPTYSNLHMPKP
jgi:hypothetical protein